MYRKHDTSKKHPQHTVLPHGSTSQNVRDRPVRYAYRASGLILRCKSAAHLPA